AMVVDEYGWREGIVTPTDVLEASAGEFPDLDGEAALLERPAAGSWRRDGFIALRQLSAAIGRDLAAESNRSSTLGGYSPTHLGHLRQAGETLSVEDMHFEILSLDKRSIGKVRLFIGSEATEEAGSAEP